VAAPRSGARKGARGVDALLAACDPDTLLLTTSNLAAPASAAPGSATSASPTSPPTSPLRRFFALELLDNRYPALHGLRVMSIICVVQFHITWILSIEQNIALHPTWVTYSLSFWFGMDLFFMMSGFLIGSILLRSIEIEGHQQIRRFYLRRVFRTFPSYYLVLTILALMTALNAAQREHLKFEYLYLTNFLPLGRGDVVMFWGWSVALEEQFYLTVPILFYVLYRVRNARARIGILGALWLAGLAVRLVIFLRRAPGTDFELFDTLYFRAHTRFDILIAGIVLALVHREWKTQVRNFVASRRGRLLLTITSVACLLLIARPLQFSERSSIGLLHVFAWGTLTSIMYFGVLLQLLHGHGPIQRVLAAPIFRKVATLGYGLYLVHVAVCDRMIVPLARWAQEHHVTMALVWPLSLVVLFGISLAMGYVLHILVEKPSLWIRGKLAG
jgi:peptidoglycan/LPS O-acetylase OafA/YrhL